MTTRRHWTDFPEHVSQTVLRLREAPHIVFGPCSKADAYRWRNELNRFRRAVMHEFHENENHELSSLMEPLRSMSIRVWEQAAPAVRSDRTLIKGWYVQVERAAPPPEATPIAEDLTQCIS